jgi:uncharacterized membrane protein YecN with MAPEG domain
MPITALYASLLVPLFLLLAIRVIRARRGASVAVGDGGNALLMRRMRVHANFAEYVPLALLLMALAEGLGTSNWLLHALGIALLGGRLVHAFGMSQAEEKFAFRVAGVVTTLSMLATAALACFYGALARGIGL